MGGKNPLLVCRYCFDKNIEIPCSGGRTNMKEKKDQGQKKRRGSWMNLCNKSLGRRGGAVKHCVVALYKYI